MLLKELIFSKVAARNSFLLAQEFCLDFRNTLFFRKSLLGCFNVEDWIYLLKIFGRVFFYLLKHVLFWSKDINFSVEGYLFKVARVGLFWLFSSFQKGILWLWAKVYFIIKIVFQISLVFIIRITLRITHYK